MSAELKLRWIDADDPLMQQVHALRHEALFAPFGLPRDDNWHDVGADRLHLVALLGEEVVGYTCMLLNQEGGAHLRQVSVRPDVQRGGIGRALMAECEAEGHRRAIPYLWLDARITAEPFYQRLGWTTTSEHPFACGRTTMPHVRMEKRLTER